MLNVPCFTLRDSTERPSTLIHERGTNQLIAKISDVVLQESRGRMEMCDGESSKRINQQLVAITIKNNLDTTKPEHDAYIKALKTVYEIPMWYVQGETFSRTKKRELVINKQILTVDLPSIWSLSLSANTTYQLHTLNGIIQSQLSLFAYKEYDTSIIEYCANVIVSWFDNNEKAQYPIRNAINPNWQDMAAAKRLDNILLVYELVVRYGIPTDRERFRVEILYHIKWLQLHLADVRRVRRNHVLFIARSALLGSSVYIKYFGQLEEDYVSNSVLRFYRTVTTQVDITDALSREHSTNYHILYYRQISGFCRVLDANPEVLRGASAETASQCAMLQRLSHRMYESLNYFVYPSTRFVQIGDTDDKRTNYEFGECAPLREFRGAGYIVYKRQHIYLSLSASCHSRFHKHMDELSVNYFNECPVLVEGGRYSYEDFKLTDERRAYDKWRCSYFLSQRSKNGVTIDDRYFCFNSSEDTGRMKEEPSVPGSTTIETYNESYGYGSGIVNSLVRDDGVTMTATNPILWRFQDVQHTRNVSLRGSNILLVQDRLVASGSMEHSSTRHFHFHPDWELLGVVKNIASFKHKSSHRTLEFTDSSGGRIEYYFGQETPFIQGFTSSHELHKTPAPTLEVTNYFVGSATLVCTITISTGVTVEK